MLEGKLKSLCKKHPNYSSALNRIFNWFLKNNEKSNVSWDTFYSDQFQISEHELDVVFYLLESENLLDSFYLVLDDEGKKIGKTYKDLDDIPQFIDSRWGNIVKTEDQNIDLFYKLLPNL